MIKDICGKDIKLGDWVMYATSCTSSGRLRRGQVVGFEEQQEWKQVDGKYGRFPNGKMLAKLKSFSIDTNNRRWDSKERKMVPGNPVSIGITSRSGESRYSPVKLLGSKIEDAFTQEEVEILKKSTFKILEPSNEI